MQIWFLSNGSYSLKKCHNPFGKAIQPPPPYGKIPVEHGFSLRGASLLSLVSDLLRMNQCFPALGYFFLRVKPEKPKPILIRDFKNRIPVILWRQGMFRNVGDNDLATVPGERCRDIGEIFENYWQLRRDIGCQY